MAIRLKIKTDVDEHVHFKGLIGVGVTLYDLETGGDSALGIEQAVKTKEKVTCPDCIRLVKYSKRIRKTEWVG